MQSYAFVGCFASVISKSGGPKTQVWNSIDLLDLGVVKYLEITNTSAANINDATPYLDNK